MSLRISKAALLFLLLGTVTFPLPTLAATPTIGGISVANSSNLLATIWGSGFATGAKVYVGGVVSKSTWLGGSQFLVFQVPAGGTGTVDVKVVNSDGGAATLPGGFTYDGGAVVPVIRGVAPRKTSSVLKTVWGENFETGAKVYVNDIPAPSQWQVGTQFIVFQPPTSIPSGSTVTVKVVNPSGGSNSLAANLSYTTVAGGTTGTSGGTTTGGTTGGGTTGGGTVVVFGGIKWHPGTYITSIDGKCDAAHLAQRNHGIDEAVADPNVKGIYVSFWWECLEGGSGDYSAGFKYIDDALSRLNGKKLIVGFNWEGYGDCPNAQTDIYPHLPSYIINTPGWTAYCTDAPSRPKHIFLPAFWKPEVMDRMIALQAAYAARYDSNANFEMWGPEMETAAYSWDEGSDGYTFADALTQMKRLHTMASQAWKHTQVRLVANFFGNDTQMRDYMEELGVPGTVIGGPDTLPGTGTSRTPPVSDYIFRGCAPSSGTSCVPGSLWSDLRGRIPWVSEVQWGPIYGNACASDEWNYAYNTMHMSYMLFNADGYWDGTLCHTWSYVKAWIDAHPNVYATGCPSGWTCSI